MSYSAAIAASLSSVTVITHAAAAFAISLCISVPVGVRVHLSSAYYEYFLRSREILKPGRPSVVVRRPPVIIRGGLFDWVTARGVEKKSRSKREKKLPSVGSGRPPGAP